MNEIGWKLLATGGGLLAATVARKVTDTSWKAVTGADSPQHAEDPDIGFKEALAFALVSGAIIGISRMLANKGAAQVYKKSTGHLPNSLMKKEDQD